MPQGANAYYLRVVPTHKENLSTKRYWRSDVEFSGSLCPAIPLDLREFNELDRSGFIARRTRR